MTPIGEALAPDDDASVDRGLARIAVAWATVGLLLLCFAWPLCSGFMAFFFLIPLAGAYVTVGAALIAAAALRCWQTRRADGPSRQPALVALLAGLGFAAIALFAWQPIARTGDALVARLAFAWSRSDYEAVIRAARRGTLPPADGRWLRRLGDTEYVLDAGPTLRVGFPRGGMLDSWEGVVYDPTDAVRAARGWSFDRGTQEFTAPPVVRTLFGGDLVACDPIEDHFYRCWFT